MVGHIFPLKKEEDPSLWQARFSHFPGWFSHTTVISNSCWAILVTTGVWQRGMLGSCTLAHHIYKPTFYFQVYWLIWDWLLASLSHCGWLLSPKSFLCPGSQAGRMVPPSWIHKAPHTRTHARMHTQSEICVEDGQVHVRGHVYMPCSMQGSPEPQFPWDTKAAWHLRWLVPTARLGQDAAAGWWLAPGAWSAEETERYLLQHGRSH